jgi:hypothetical protein
MPIFFLLVFPSRTIHIGHRVHPSHLFFFVAHVVTFLATGASQFLLPYRSRSQSTSIRVFPLQWHSQYLLLPRKFSGNMFQSGTSTKKVVHGDDDQEMKSTNRHFL